MGSIFGLALTKNNNVRNKTLVRSILYSLMLSAKQAKAESVGLALTTDTGVTLIRKACDAKAFFDDPSISKIIDESLCVDASSKKLLSVLGHCHTGKGNESIELEDIHPVHRDRVVGAYSGYIFNPDEITRPFSIKRNGTYSGELFFSLISSLYKKYKPTVKSPFTMAMEEAAETAVGPLAAACMCTDNPHMLWLAKTNLSISVRNYYETGMILFAESDLYLTSATVAWSLGAYEIIPFVPDSILGIDLFYNAVVRKKVNARII